MSDQRDTGFHQLNIGHLVMGIALLGLVGVWALWQGDAVTGDDLRWLMPIPWVLAGVVGLVATAITGPRRHVQRQTGWVGTGIEPGTGAGWVGERPAEQQPDGSTDQKSDQTSDQKNDQETS